MRACFAALYRLAARGPANERDFGWRADFRAGLHCGSVVVGELGYLKKEIALIGDSREHRRADTGSMPRHRLPALLASAALIEQHRRASRRRDGSLARSSPDARQATVDCALRARKRGRRRIGTWPLFPKWSSDLLWSFEAQISSRCRCKL